MHHSAESAILDYFGSSTIQYEDERNVIGTIIRQQILTQGHVSNKAVILRLIEMLDCSNDVLEQDVLRNALEMVLGRTEDDIGF